jgi:propionate CoA-transferase
MTATEAVRLIRDGDSVVVDLEKDILAHIGFEPIIKVNRVRWTPGSSPTDSWALRNDLLTVPLEARFADDTGRNMFFLNMEGMSLATLDEVESIGTKIEKQISCTPVRLGGF